MSCASLLRSEVGHSRRVAVQRVLKDRWSGANQQRARAVVECLMTGDSLDELPLDEHDGRADLRGLWLVSTKGLPGLGADALATTPTAEAVAWNRLDLSGSTVRIDLRGAVLSDVRLDRVGWRDWKVQRSTLTDCSFVGAALGDVQFDWGNPGLQDRPVIGMPSRLDRCDFSGTKLGAYAGFGRAELTDCHFVDTRFPSPMWFRGASVRGCLFAGCFRDVCFGWTGTHQEPAPFLSADISAAQFESCEVYSHSGPGLHGLA